MICPHCRADTPVSTGSCIACTGRLPLESAVETVASPVADLAHGFPSDGATISSGAPRDPARVPAPALPGPPLSIPEGATISSGSVQATSSVSAGLLPGQLFAQRYRIERLLGTGGMGAVYKAHDVELGVPIALKVIRTEILADPTTGRDFELRFKQELLLARKVTHQNVLRIHDLGESSGIKYITMPLVEGSDLHAQLAHGPLPFERVMSLARQIASGLGAAHEVGIVHRDLKPQNIMIDAAGRAYISDFGLAKSYEASAVGLTRKGDFIGTPKYIAPEIVEGKPADHRSDLYALGLMFYEMASGVLPFTGESVMELLMQRVRKPAKDLREVKPDIPEFFSRIVMRCLAKEPAARYQDAKQIAADLEAARAPAKSPAHTVSITLPLPSRRGWIVASMVVAAIVALAAIPPVRNFVLGRTAAVEGIPPASERMLIAVIPFRITGSSEELEYIGSGVAEGLTAKLFGMSAITVAPASALAGIDPKQPLPRLAHELGSNLIVSGTVQGGGNRIAINVNLDEPLADRHIWTQQFTGDPKDILTLQDQIFTQLVEALAITPTTAERARSVSRPTNNVAAYELYLKGRNAMRGQQDRRNVEAAIKLYEQALDADPRFALAFAGLADASVQMYREVKDRLWADRAVYSAQQGKALDEKLVEVQLAAGNAYLATGRTNEAIAELKQALDLAPNSDEAHRRLAAAYGSLGQIDEAIGSYQKAIQVNPYYWLNHNALGAMYWRIGEYDKAAAAFQKVIELEPGNVNGFNDLGAAYLQTGRYAEAASAFEQALKLLPTAETYSNLGIAYAWQGRFQDALAPYARAVELRPGVYGWLGNLADGYRWVGQSDKAGETYDQAIASAYKELQVNPTDALTRSYLGTYYAKKGDTTQGLKFVQEAEAADPNDVSIIYNVAVVRALAGQDDRAIEDLRKAFRAGYPARFAQDDPDLKRLAGNARFRTLVEQSARPATSR
jgi:eukaryotic-like serine/threonine-protein kinase